MLLRSSVQLKGTPLRSMRPSRKLRASIVSNGSLSWSRSSSTICKDSPPLISRSPKLSYRLNETGRYREIEVVPQGLLDVDEKLGRPARLEFQGEIASRGRLIIDSNIPFRLHGVGKRGLEDVSQGG